MTTAGSVAGRHRLNGGGLIRWAACLALMLVLHFAAVVALLHRELLPPVVLPPAPETVTLELLPEPPAVAAPEPEPEPPPRATPDLAIPEPFRPAPPASFSVPVPASTGLDQRDASSDATLPISPPRPAQQARRPPARLPAPRPVSRSAVAQAGSPDTSATPPAPPASFAPTVSASNASLSAAVPTWRGQLMGKLLRAKHYPEGARARGEQGTAYATFTMDRSGHVLAAAVIRGSGSYQLDEEAVALIHRAEPLPPMPTEMPGATATLTVPVSFALR